MLASWMGGEEVAGGRPDPARGRHPDVRLPGHRLRPVQPPVALRRQPALPVRDAAPAGGPRARRVPRGGRPDHRGRHRRGPHAAHRVREQEGPGRVRHPDHGHRARPDAGRGGRGGRGHRLPGGRQAAVADDHAQDRRRRRGPQPAHRRTPSARPSTGSATSVAEKVGRRALRGRDDPADDQLDRLRADRGQQPRPAVRPGPPVRHGRPAGRGVQGPGAGAAAAQHDARAAPDRRDHDRARRCKGVRGRKPIDKEVLAALLVRFSELVAEQPRIAEIDINPLLASPERVIALDARVVLHPAAIADADLPRLAIRPYPHEYEREATTDDGVRDHRPARSGPRTSPRVARFHAAPVQPDGPSPATARTGRCPSGPRTSGSPASASWTTTASSRWWPRPRPTRRRPRSPASPGVSRVHASRRPDAHDGRRRRLAASRHRGAASSGRPSRSRGARASRT